MPDYRLSLLDSRVCFRGYDLTLREAVARLYGKKATIAKFLTSGCSAAGVNFSLLYVLTGYAGLHYLASSTIASIAAICLGFTMQKFWTFANKSTDVMHKQAVQYGLLAITNMAINAALMFVLVDSFHMWYMLAQFFVCGVLAFSNFLVYHLFIFRPEPRRS